MAIKELLDESEEYYMKDAAEKRHKALNFLIQTEGRKETQAMVARLIKFYSEDSESNFAPFKKNVKRLKHDLSYIALHKDERQTVKA